MPLEVASRPVDCLAANEFFVFVSLDGPREANDTNRVFAGSGRGTYYAVATRLADFQSRHPDSRWSLPRAPTS